MQTRKLITLKINKKIVTNNTIKRYYDLITSIKIPNSLSKHYSQSLLKHTHKLKWKTDVMVILFLDFSKPLDDHELFKQEF